LLVYRSVNLKTNYAQIVISYQLLMY